METEINKTNSKFGIEVEFYIVDQNGYPILNSNELVKDECIEVDSSLSIVQELSSFQIEINPGPWQLNSIGLTECISKLKYHYNILKKVVENHGWALCETLMPTNLTQSILNHPSFFSQSPRFKASADYFTKGKDILLQNSYSKLIFSGETIIGCINEIHIHAQLSDDSRTINLFNYLNSNGLELTKPYNQSILVNDHIYKDINSLTLFELANGEWNNDETVFRVGNLPDELKSSQEYERILESFKKIPLNTNTDLDLESTVYYWTRLRGKSNDLRVEFRPMEMGVNWIDRVKYLYKIIKDFEKSDPDCQAHLQFAQPNAKT